MLCVFFIQLEELSKKSKSGILSYEGLNRTIILLDGFYNIAQYEKPYINSIASGISTVIFGKRWTDRNQISDLTTLKAYDDLEEKVGPWYGIARNWSSNTYVLELYSNITNQESVNYRFYIYDSAWAMGGRFKDSSTMGF